MAGNPDQVVVVLVSAASPAEAGRIADALVGERIAACANLLPSVTSRYWWEGKVTEAAEALLLLKTVRRRVPVLIRRVREISSYEIPEVLVLPSGGGSHTYLDWVRSECREERGQRREDGDPSE